MKTITLSVYKPNEDQPIATTLMHVYGGDDVLRTYKGVVTLEGVEYNMFVDVE